MIMSGGKKKEASMIVASMKPPMADSVAPEMEQDAKDMAAEEIMAAIDARDSGALKEAMKSFVSMCMDEYSSEDVASAEGAEAESE